MISTSKPRATRRAGALLAATIALATLASQGCVHADPGPVALSIVDRDTGQAMRVWRHDGRLFVAGRPGALYAIHVANHTDGRVLVILSVDGVDVMSGATGSYDQGGYVLDPHESYDVKGWRKSNSEVAAFTFAALSQSYAARTGRPGEVGVIGMAVFTEQAPRPEPWADAAPPRARAYSYNGSADASLAAPLSVPPPPPPPPSAAAPAPRTPAYTLSAPAPYRERDEKLGTAHGAREWSYVSDTSFERATSDPVSVRKIEYDTPAHLIAMGVIPRWYGALNPRPNPFPDAARNQGFVPDPPTYP